MSSDLINKMLEQESFAVVVKPNSRKNAIVKYDINKNTFIIEIKAEARNNKANIGLIKYLSKLLKRNIKIVRGFNSKEKRLKVL